MSTFEEIRKYLDTLSLSYALWWFIENGDAYEATIKNGLFFYLRERVRT